MLTRLHKLLVLSAACCLLLGAASCKKDKTSGTAIAGKYRLVYYPGDDSLPQYYVFNDDNTYEVLSQNNQAVKEIGKGVYTHDEPSLTLSSFYNVYLLRRSGDTLKLVSNPDANDDQHIVLVKDNNAPAAADWIQGVNVTAKLPVPDIQLTCFTVLGGNFIASWQYEILLRRYAVTTGLAQTWLNTTEKYFGITNAGNVLWGVTDNGKLKRINPATGAVLFSALNSPTGIDLVAGNASTLYCSGISSNAFITYDIASDTYGTSRRFNGDLRHLVMKGSYLYGASYRYIYKIDPVTLQVVKSYTVNGIEGVSGLAFDGTDFWIYVSDRLQSPGYFGKISLD